MPRRAWRDTTRNNRWPGRPADAPPQAWKIVIPTSRVNPEPRAHDGYEWIYVLSGRMRLILGDQDWVLAPGEVADFDTRVPHWFGSTGHEPVEIPHVAGIETTHNYGRPTVH
jgi:quercetin dioxygenase-like cupin family protein